MKKGYKYPPSLGKASVWIFEKCMHFNGMVTTSKYLKKDQLKELLQYEVEIAANWYVKTFKELSKVSRA